MALNDDFREIAIGSLIALVVLLVFSIWTEIAPEQLGRLSYEDGVIEYITAILFGISAICFVYATRTCAYLKARQFRFSFFTLCWALFAFLIMGEEISWGLRIPAKMTDHSEERDRFAHRNRAGAAFLN